MQVLTAQAEDFVEEAEPINCRAPMRSIEVIVKVAERCNLACSYCYYFFAGDQSYKSRPARMSRKVIERLAAFLAEGAAKLELPMLKVVFHGGEPLMLRKADFEYACETLHREISPLTTLELTVQTNGVLIDAEWVEIFRRHRVGVGVSIDGDAEVNDRSRVDHRGRGSYERIVKGLRQLQAAAVESPWLRPGLLSVLNAANDTGQIYSHFVDELGATAVSTLLPDCSHDDGIPDGYTAENYGRILCSLFDKWVEKDSVQLREVNRLLSRFQKGDRSTWFGRRNPIVVVQSDGSLAMDDSYIPAQDWRVAAPRGSIFTDQLADWVWNDAYREIDSHYAAAPSACGGCAWLNICGGGDLENRYSTARGFDNPSVFCDGLKMFYLHVTKYLVRSGYPVDDMLDRLGF